MSREVIEKMIAQFWAWNLVEPLRALSVPRSSSRGWLSGSSGGCSVRRSSAPRPYLGMQRCIRQVCSFQCWGPSTGIKPCKGMVYTKYINTKVIAVLHAIYIQHIYVYWPSAVRIQREIIDCVHDLFHHLIGRAVQWFIIRHRKVNLLNGRCVVL